MIDNRHLYLLVCAAASACAKSSPQPVAHDAHDEVAIAAPAVPLPEPEATVAVKNPYAPTRLLPLHSYGWQNPLRPPCGKPGALPGQAETVSTQVKLSFSGSVASFPLLPEDDPNAILPKREDEPPLDTWGSGPNPEAVGKLRRDPDFVVASLRPRLRGCFSSWLERRAEAEGSIRFALELGCAGEVQTISAKVEGVDEPTVECLFAVVAPATFDPPAGGHATIQVPVVFKNSGR